MGNARVWVASNSYTILINFIGDYNASCQAHSRSISRFGLESDLDNGSLYVLGCFIMVKHYTYALSESATLRRGTMQHISILKPRS